MPTECSALKCYMERDLSTGNTDKDLAFTPTAVKEDYMVIKPGRAKVWINKATTNFALPAMNDANITPLELKVPLSATFITVSLASAAATMAVLAF